METQVIDWMLEGPEWVRYAVEKQLLGKDPDVDRAVSDQTIQSLLTVFRGREHGFEALIENKVSYTGELYWYLYFLADIGFTANDFGLKDQFDKILELENNGHRFLLSKEMKPDYFCISSILLTAMARMSGEVKDRLKSHLVTIMDAQRLDGGWHCAKSRAVGRKEEKSVSCLMENLNVLMLFAEYEEYSKQPRFEGAIDLLLEHWRRRDEKWRPYGFGIGSEFRKLRYPAFKYGILRVLDVLSMYPYAVKQPEFREMLGCVLKKSEDGIYKAESTAKMFKAFDFGQRKEPSRWITFLINRFEKRVDQSR